MAEQTRVAVGSTIGFDEVWDDLDTVSNPSMAGGIAAHWDSWSMLLGKGAQKILQDLAADMPQLRNATIATADGLNLCSIGVADDQVGRVVAVSASMLAVSRSFSGTVHGGPDAYNGTLAHIATGRTHSVMVSLVEEPLGQLLVSLTAEGIDPGRLAGAAIDTSRRVSAWLRAS